VRSTSGKSGDACPGSGGLETNAYNITVSFAGPGFVKPPEPPPGAAGRGYLYPLNNLSTLVLRLLWCKHVQEGVMEPILVFMEWSVCKLRDEEGLFVVLLR